MKYVALKDASNRLIELVRQVEAGETVIITRNGEPVVDIVPHTKKRGLNFERGDAYLRSRGVDRAILWISPDFDDPVSENFGALPEKV